MHFLTRQAASFSMHSTADLLKISREDVESRYDDIEKEMLSRFFAFIRDKLDRYWIHWRMTDLTYGFEHLEHRSRFLGNPDPPIINFENRLDLSAILQEKYGRDFAQSPRMINLARLNGPLPQGFLSGQQEADAFKSKDFIRKHASTLAKVDFFRHVIILAQKGKLRTASRGWEARIDRLMESRANRAGGLLGWVIGLIVGIYQLYLWLR